MEHSAAETPLATIYLQIEYATDPLATFGLFGDATASDIRTAYRALALRLHPDKCALAQREFHTGLFQKVQEAYDGLERRFGGPDEDDPVYTAPKRLPETAAALHARNIDHRDRLRGLREEALRAKRAAGEKKVAKGQSQKLKDELLVCKLMSGSWWPQLQNVLVGRGRDIC